MKRILLITVVVGLFAGQAFAGLYEMDATTAAGLRLVSVSDMGVLSYVGYNPGTNPALFPAGDYVFGTNFFYGATHPMTYAVGFTGTLTDGLDADGASSMLIGAKGQSVLPTSGLFTGFRLPISNDNDDTWQYKIYVDTNAGSGVEYETAWTPAAPGLLSPGQITLTLGFGLDGSGNPIEVDFANLVDIGFGIQLNRGFLNADGSLRQGDGDEFHTSVVPVPAAVLLGFLGLGAAGLKLRRFA